jgi:hypothetical protein
MTVAEGAAAASESANSTAAIATTMHADSHRR